MLPQKPSYADLSHEKFAERLNPIPVENTMASMIFGLN